jgi:murein tripeptide amidase MpaA
MTTDIIINSNFDGGNIECIDASRPDHIQLSIRSDEQSDFYQWFYFRAANVLDLPCRYVITNAANAAYPRGWENYQAVASYDREYWFRVESSYENGQLIIQHTSTQPQIYFSYFAPYSMERHADLIAYAQSSGGCDIQTLGTTIDGQSIDCLQFGSHDEHKKKLWMIARQHPGETMAEWWMEGMINKLLDENDAVVKSILEKAVIYLVPNMNPDGSRRGHLRTNAVGANLNREWESPTLLHSPEVYHVFEKMKATGVDFALDVHGDESLPYNFIAGTQGIPSWNPLRQLKLDTFKNALARINPDFQTAQGYPPNPPGTANMSYCSNAVAEYFNCPAMTLEMPFKDTYDTPDPLQGWSPERCIKLAESCLDAIHQSWQQLID